MRVSRTNSEDPHFLQLVEKLNAELAERDGEDHAFYSLYNSLEEIQHAVVCFEGSQAVACGAIKTASHGTMEIKRMYVLPGSRGTGVATAVLTELERWAADLGMTRLILETGKRQPEAIRLYEKSRYRRIENFGPYAGIENSVCFEKQLTDST